MTLTAEKIIEILDLKPLPGEGGFYKRTYTSKHTINFSDTCLKNSNIATRSLNSAIYFLIDQANFSMLHRLPTDEIFHFYCGDAVSICLISPDKVVREYTLGTDIARGQIPQFVVPAYNWQGLRLQQGGQYALLGTTMAPAFEFEDLELFSAQNLQLFQKEKEILKKYFVES